MTPKRLPPLLSVKKQTPVIGKITGLLYLLLRAGRLVLPVLVMFGAACTATLTPASTPSASAGPTVDFQTPQSGTSVSLNQAVQVYAIVEDAQGIQHADFMVNGIIVYTQNVSIFTRRFDFSYIWQPDAPGTYNLLVIGYNRNGQGNPSLAHVLTVGGSAPTPIVIRITATPAFRIVTPEPPTLLAPTPYVLRVTATPDLSKLFTPFAPSPTPNVVIVPFGQ